jgi:biopolymer transport protein ExbD
MAWRALGNGTESPTQIDLAPMIDCVFILLIFFVVTTVFVEEPGVEIQRPDAVVDQPLERTSILIAISPENAVVYGGKEIGVAGVGPRVRQLLQKEDLPVVIQADARAEHGVFSSVWSEAKHAGARTISVATRRD